MLPNNGKIIPLCKAYIGEEESRAVQEVLNSGWLTHGPKNIEFENSFAEYLGVKNAIAMNSCTSALFLSILANNIKGEVLVPSFTFVASANAIVTAGAKPVFVDINYNDCNIDASLLESYITSKTEAIMAVHYAGQCCDMDRIMDIANKHKLLVIEDSAETIGGTYKNLKSGSWGIGCYSFFPTKNITTGEGGMLTTNDDALASRVKTLLGHGIDKTTAQRTGSKNSWYRAAVVPGYNFRMSNILATLGVEQMKKVDKMNALRRQHSYHLIENLRDVEEIDLPVENADCRHVFQMFTLKVKNGERDNFVFYLKERGIEASVHFDPPVHLHPAYSEYKYSKLPVTENVTNNILTLPMFPGMEENDLNYIVSTIKEYFERPKP